jgi:hypothetical protein
MDGMKAEEYNDWVEATVTELMDARLANDLGQIAGEWLAVELGLSGGDIVNTDDVGEVVLSTPMAEINQRIAAVKAAQAAGGSALDVLPWRS